MDSGRNITLTIGSVVHRIDSPESKFLDSVVWPFSTVQTEFVQDLNGRNRVGRNDRQTVVLAAQTVDLLKTQPP